MSSLFIVILLSHHLSHQSQVLLRSSRPLYIRLIMFAAQSIAFSSFVIYIVRFMPDYFDVTVLYDFLAGTDGIDC